MDIGAQREQFEKEKKALLEEFKFNIGISGVSTSVSAAPDEVVLGNEEGGFGSGTVPAGLIKVGGLSEEEWRKAGNYQRQIDVLHTKWPLSSEEIARLDGLEARRNTLWKKAVSAPGLTGEERERLRLKLHTQHLHAGEPKPPVATTEQIEVWMQAPPQPTKPEPTTSAPAPDFVNPIAESLVANYGIEDSDALIDLASQYAEEASQPDDFGNFLGLARIAVAYKKGGISSALASAADFVIGKIPIPQATLAVEGGRIYANVAFQALDKFMTDAMAAIGSEFDKDRFWSELTDQCSTGQKAVMEWIGHDTE